MPTSITGNSISLGSGADATSITNTGILNHAGTLQLGNSTVTTFPAGHVLQIHTCRLTVDLSTTSDGNVTTGLTTSFVPIQGSDARIIATIQGGAQRTDSTSDRGVTSLYINTNNGSGTEFYGYMGCYNFNSAYLVPHSAFFSVNISNYPNDGSAITVSAYMREQGGNGTYHFHDNVGGLSSNCYFTVMEVGSSGAMSKDS